jgi:hypothetical protein
MPPEEHDRREPCAREQHVSRLIENQEQITVPVEREIARDGQPDPDRSECTEQEWLAR